METTKIGEVFIDGRIINLDNVSIDEIENYKKIIIEKRNKVINSINNVLKEY